MDKYRYYCQHLERLWKNLELNREVRREFERKYLEQVLLLLREFQMQREKFQLLETKVEGFIRMTEDETK